MSVTTDLVRFGDILIAKKHYDFDVKYSRYDFLKAAFFEKRNTIKKINKSFYGKW